MDALIADLDWPKQQGEAGPEELAGFTFHGLRHYAICAWVGAGLGVKAVQTFAGHSSIDQTRDQYGYLFPKEEHWAKIEIASELIYKEAPQIADKTLTKRSAPEP